MRFTATMLMSIGLALSAGARGPNAFGLGQQFTNLDGIEVMPEGSFIVSDYMGRKVAAVLHLDRSGAFGQPASMRRDKSRSV